jgi:two-component system, LytTR family, sensor histidine kinase AlgZ
VHPILTSRARLLIYVAAWAPIAALLTIILSHSGAMAWTQAAALVFPMCLLYSFVCMASWYLCRAVPLRETEILRLAGTHAMAGFVCSGLWLVMGQILAVALDATSYFEGIDEQYLNELPILFLSGILLFLLAVSFNYLLIMLDVSRRSETRALELQVQAREAELKTLRAQIDPHFLFNSLNSISALVMADPAAARRMCLLLAEFLRGSLKIGSEERIPLVEEMKLAEHYLEIEKVRLGSRLTVQREIDPESENCLVPPLIIQPLVENAVLHGVAPMLDGGTIRIEARRNGAFVNIVLENPFEPEASDRNGAGLGLKNVKMRLANLFDGKARVDVEQTDSRFRVELQLPCGRS